MGRARPSTRIRCSNSTRARSPVRSPEARGPSSARSGRTHRRPSVPESSSHALPGPVSGKTFFTKPLISLSQMNVIVAVRSVSATSRPRYQRWTNQKTKTARIDWPLRLVLSPSVRLAHTQRPVAFASLSGIARQQRHRVRFSRSTGLSNVTPGQKVSALSNDGVAGTLVVVELTN